MKKIIVIMFLASLSVVCAKENQSSASDENNVSSENRTISSSVTNALSLDDAIALYESGKRVDDIKELLAKGINATNDSPYESGYTPLMYASKYGYIEILKSLISNGADVNIEDNNDVTALMGASTFGYIDIVKILIKEGAKVNIKDNSGDTFNVGI